MVWARLTPGAASKNGTEKSRSGPVRSTPIALLRRKDFSVWNSVFPRPVVEEMTFSTVTQEVYDYLKTRGASFFSDIVEGTKLLRSQVEESLAELVAKWTGGVRQFHGSARIADALTSQDSSGCQKKTSGSGI